MDLTPLIRRLRIRTKSLTIAPLEPNWAQVELLDAVHRQMKANKPVRLIVLKARQLGISTITEAILFTRGFVFNHSHSLVVAHEIDASEYLFGMTKLYWETFPYRDLYTTKYVSKKELEWVETGSSIRIATARNVRAGRGRTIHALHASEVGFWERPEETMLGMRQTIPARPGTFICLESTANGVGNWFYDTWNAAVDSEVDFEPLFFPWWKHPEYTASAMGLAPERVGLNLDADEKILIRLGCDEDHLVWRRWAVRNLADGDINLFMQEYPATPEEAFLATGTNVFPLEKLKLAYEPMEGVRGLLVRHGEQVKFVKDRTGPLRVFRMPSTDADWGRYFVAGDPTHSTMGDAACAQVINRRTYEQVAVWHGRTDPMSFADDLCKLGIFYNHACITTEVEGPGYATIGRLVGLDYPDIWRHKWADKVPGKLSETMGWSTTWKRKEWAIGWLLKLVVDQDVKLHDRITFDQMRNYVTLENGGYGPADEQHGHDDAVMAMAIACICSSTDGPLSAYEADQQKQNFREPIPSWSSWEE